MTSRLAFTRTSIATYAAYALGVDYRVYGAGGAYRAFRVTDGGGLHPAAEGGELPTRASAYAQCEADLEHVLADREPAADVGPVTDEQLAAVPLEHRRTVARWLTERAGTFKASSLFGPFLTDTVHDALQGAATDLMTPGVDDTTIGHARAGLRDLAIPPCTCHEPSGQSGCGQHAPVMLRNLQARQDLDDEYAAERLEREV
jgi:hypothetical protein